MDIDDNELPPASTSAKPKSQRFTIDPADVLAKQRQISNEIFMKQQDELNMIMNLVDSEKLFPDPKNLETQENSSDCLQGIADADETTCQLLLTKHIKNLSVAPPKPEIIKINPGIIMKDLDLSQLAEKLEPKRVEYIHKTFQMLESDDDEKLRRNIDLVSLSLCRLNVDNKLIPQPADILCLALVVSVVKLDRRCRTIYTSVDNSSVMRVVLQTVPRNLRTDEFVKDLCNDLMTCFTNMHDRLEIANGFNFAKVRPKEIDRQESIYFPLRVARRLYFANLCEIIEGDVQKIGHNLSDLVKVIKSGRKIIKHKMDANEHYLFIKILCALRQMLQSNKNEDYDANKWLLKFINTLKLPNIICSVDAQKIKYFQSKTHLLWRSM